MDAEFIGGQDLNGLCKKGRGRLVKWSEVLSLSKVEVFVAPPTQPKKVKKVAKKQQAWKITEAKKQKVDKKKKAVQPVPSSEERKSVKKNGVAPAANDGLTQLLQNAKISKNTESQASTSKDGGNLKALLTKEGILPSRQQPAPRPIMVPPPRGVPPPMLVPRGMPVMPRMMPRMPGMMPGMVQTNMPGMQPMFVIPPRPMMPMPRGPSVGVLPMGPTIEVKKRDDKNTPEKRVKREKKKVTSALKPSHV